MYKTIKFTVEQSANVFAISDLHIGHCRPFIFANRGFSSVEEHDETLISRWNETCNHDSTIINCGDVVFSDPDGSKFINLMRRLNFRKHYILIGNHTSGQKQCYAKTLKEQFPNAVADDGRFNYEVYPLEMAVDGNIAKTVVFLPEYAEFMVGKHSFVACHYPIISHNQQSHKSTLLVGHSHGSCAITNKNTGKGFRLDVGVESFGRPISLADIRAFFAANNRDIDSVDHHNAQTT